MNLTYETHFKSERPDGRLTSSIAAHMEMMRRYHPPLALPEDLTPESFRLWQEKVRKKVRELLLLPEFTEQPAPVRIAQVQRDGYLVEKWELYPDDVTVVPFLMLIPDGVDENHPAPGVICIPGSIHSKEFIAGEPLLDRPTCRFVKYPERNAMAKYLAQNGMVALAFDNPETAECALDIEREGDYGGYARTQMCFGYIQSGLCYAGISVFQKLCALQFMKNLPFIDQNRIGVSAHSLGTMPALFLGLLCDEVKAVVFNDFVCDPRERYMSVTEEPENAMQQNSGNWHEIPGLWKWFGHQDLLAALAPKYLACNEGGAQIYLDTIKKGYEAAGVPDHVQISRYPQYAETPGSSDPLPQYGLSGESYFAYCTVDAPDHSYRAAPSIHLLKTCFCM